VTTSAVAWQVKEKAKKREMEEAIGGGRERSPRKEDEKGHEGIPCERQDQSETIVEASSLRHING